jgi:hypothetical protein
MPPVAVQPSGQSRRTALTVRASAVTGSPPRVYDLGGAVVRGASNGSHIRVLVR